MIQLQQNKTHNTFYRLMEYILKLSNNDKLHTNSGDAI